MYESRATQVLGGVLYCFSLIVYLLEPARLRKPNEKGVPGEEALSQPPTFNSTVQRTQLALAELIAQR